MLKKFNRILLFALFMCLTLTSCSRQPTPTERKAIITDDLKVHFIDVGQGDSILVRNGTQNMLIDTGPRDHQEQLLEYLNAQGIKNIDYLILTHQHSDHVGNAAKIVKNYSIGKLYMPDVTSDENEFKDTIKAIKKSNLNITRPLPGSSFDLGDAKCTIFAPNSDKYEDENDYSIVIKLTYKNTSFLFAGDALAQSESEMINKGFDLSADVLKIGHHGGSDATSEEFLSKVKPRYTVLSCRKYDSSEHPSKKTMHRIKGHGMPVFRTDESGPIVCTSDGNNISFDKQPGSYEDGKQ